MFIVVISGIIQCTKYFKACFLLTESENDESENKNTFSNETDTEDDFSQNGCYLNRKDNTDRELVMLKNYKKELTPNVPAVTYVQELPPFPSNRWEMQV